MSARYKGVQHMIKCNSSYVNFYLCFAHSLNLVGTCAVESSTEAAALFLVIQKLYTFYSSSAMLCQKQRDTLEKCETNHLVVVKRLSGKRWSARYDAVRALALGYTEHLELLKELSFNDEYRAEVKCEAWGLSKRLKELETSILLKAWNTILERINNISEQLQKEGLSLNSAVYLFKSLLIFIESLCGRFDDFEMMSIEMCGNSSYKNDVKGNREGKRRFVAKWLFQDKYLHTSCW